MQVKGFILHADRWTDPGRQSNDPSQPVAEASADVSGFEFKADGSMGAAGVGSVLGTCEGGGEEAREAGDEGGGGGKLPEMDLVRLEDLHGNIFWDIEMNALSSKVAEQFSAVSMVCLRARTRWCVCVCAHACHRLRMDYTRT